MGHSPECGGRNNFNQATSAQRTINRAELPCCKKGTYSLQRNRGSWGLSSLALLKCALASETLLRIKGKRQKAIYRLVTAPQGGTQKYTLAFAYDSPR